MLKEGKKLTKNAGLEFPEFVTIFNSDPPSILLPMKQWFLAGVWSTSNYFASCSLGNG